MDEDLLKNYCEAASDLRNYTYLTHKIKMNISIGGTREGMKMSSTMPSKPILSEYLMSFRLFFMNDEEINFSKVINKLMRFEREAGNEKNMEELADIRNVYRLAFKQAATVMNFNEQDVAPSELIDLILYSNSFHFDRQKVERLKQLESMIPHFAHFLALLQIDIAVKAILALADFIQSTYLASKKASQDAI